MNEGYLEAPVALFLYRMQHRFRSPEPRNAQGSGSETPSKLVVGALNRRTVWGGLNRSDLGLNLWATDARDEEDSR